MLSRDDSQQSDRRKSYHITCIMATYNVCVDSLESNSPFLFGFALAVLASIVSHVCVYIRTRKTDSTLWSFWEKSCWAMFRDADNPLDTRDRRHFLLLLLLGHFDSHSPPFFPIYQMMSVSLSWYYPSHDLKNLFYPPFYFDSHSSGDGSVVVVLKPVAPDHFFFIWRGGQSCPDRSDRKNFPLKKKFVEFLVSIWFVCIFLLHFIVDTTARVCTYDSPNFFNIFICNSKFAYDAMDSKFWSKCQKYILIWFCLNKQHGLQWRTDWRTLWRSRNSRGSSCAAGREAIRCRESSGTRTASRWTRPANGSALKPKGKRNLFLVVLLCCSLSNEIQLIHFQASIDAENPLRQGRGRRTVRVPAKQRDRHRYGFAIQSHCRQSHCRPVVILRSVLVVETEWQPEAIQRYPPTYYLLTDFDRLLDFKRIDKNNQMRLCCGHGQTTHTHTHTGKK